MQFWTITPSKFMAECFKTSDTTLVLAHLISEKNEYQKKCLEFKKMGGRLCLDNSYYEKRQNLPVYDLVKKAQLIKADILVLPDLPFKDDLRKEIMSNIKYTRRFGFKGELMMCVFADGKDFKEDLEMFKLLLTIDGLDYIAIPYVFLSLIHI